MYIEAASHRGKLSLYPENTPVANRPSYDIDASIRTVEDMARAAALGAELIISNEPEYMIAELKRVGLREKE